MANPFFEHPILNSPYECPLRHWELDQQGQPTQRIIENRRRAEFITPIPRPRKRKKGSPQQTFVFDEGKGLSSRDQQYDPTSIINEVRGHVKRWREWPKPSEWEVTAETARLLEHWRHHKFAGVRPFFCQVEAVETAIWLTEVAPQSKSGKQILENLAAANKDADPELLRLALKLATGAGKTTVIVMLNTLETEGQMLQRVMPDLMGMKNILVLNDEAHHCYRAKPKDPDEEELKGDEKQEAEKNRKAARLWISGLEAVNRKLGLARVFDLSATPFFLRGSGYAEGTLFPWTMSDFSLMDAIECGIVKLPRVPVAENIPGNEMPVYRDLWENVGKDMPKKGRGRGGELDPLKQKKP